MALLQQARSTVNYPGQQLELEIIAGQSTHLHPYLRARSSELGNQVKKLLP